jgi:hypothetical protein
MHLYIKLHGRFIGGVGPAGGESEVTAVQVEVT